MYTKENGKQNKTKQSAQGNGYNSSESTTSVNNESDHKPWHFEQYSAPTTGLLSLYRLSCPVGVFEYCCIQKQQTDELSWRQPVAYLWMQLGGIED